MNCHATQSRPEHRDGPVALVVWIVAQTAVLVALSRGWTISIALTSADSLACMAAASTALAALLFPALVRSWRNVASATGVVIVMLALAAGLAEANWRQAASSVLYLSMWLLALRAWAPLLRSRRKSLLGQAIAALLCLGAGVAHYARVEFSAGGWWSIFPISAAWHAGTLHFPPLIDLTLLAVLLIVAVIGRGHWRAMTDLSTTDPRQSGG